jgi:hypothetical protein
MADSESIIIAVRWLGGKRCGGGFVVEIMNGRHVHDASVVTEPAIRRHHYS